MMGIRAMFVFVLLFLVMIMIVSTVPVHKNEETIDKSEEKHVDEETTTWDEVNETSTVPVLITDHLLFLEVIAIPLGKNVKTDDTLLFKKEGKIPVTPEPDVLQTFKF